MSKLTGSHYRGRKRGTLDQMVQVMRKIQGYPGINFEINSVFSPQTVSDLSGSMRFIIEHDGPDITFNLSSMEEWSSSNLETLKKELERLTDFLVVFYKEKKGTRQKIIINFVKSSSSPNMS
jgi:sulfatase maturation enzyme AslB (radical SAM superfamily)